MLKISASYSKKVPGAEQYSSEGYHVSIEAECPQSLLEDSASLQEQVQSLFAEARSQVDQQITGEAPQQGSRPHLANGNGNGRTQSQPKASNRQINYAVSLAKRVWNLSPDELARELRVNRLDELTTKQASDLIERLKATGRAS